MVRLTLQNLPPEISPFFPRPYKGAVGKNGPMNSHFGGKRGFMGNRRVKT